MRTKTLLLAAVLSATGVASSLAQVYSVNTVGYVNKTLVPGFQLIANPLDNKAPNGNTISNLFTGLPEGTVVYPYAGGVFQTIGFEFGEWSNPNFQLIPGQGVFIFIPGAANVTVTFVGDVRQGTAATGNPLVNTIPKGLSIQASQVPQAGKLQTDLKYTPEEGDTVYQYNTTTKAYVTLSYEFSQWSAEPTLQIAESIFLNSPNAKTWTRDFSTSTP